jgi:hypothetical protein
MRWLTHGVIPAKAGIQHKNSWLSSCGWLYLFSLDTGFRRYDGVPAQPPRWCPAHSPFLANDRVSMRRRGLRH